MHIRCILGTKPRGGGPCRFHEINRVIQALLTMCANQQMVFDLINILRLEPFKDIRLQDFISYMTLGIHP